jgi:hypothetical protein
MSTGPINPKVNDASSTGQASTALGSTPPLEPTPAQVLIEQYKLLEDRRKYFGSQFMQTIGGVGAIVSILIGLLGGKPENKGLLQPAFVFSGLAFVLLAVLAYRLGSRQDDCELAMSNIESALRCETDDRRLPARAWHQLGRRGNDTVVISGTSTRGNYRFQ